MALGATQEPKRNFNENEKRKKSCALIFNILAVEVTIMEERVEGMTDNQWDNIIKLVGMVVKNCKSTEQVLTKLRMLCRKPEEFDKYLESENDG